MVQYYTSIPQVNALWEVTEENLSTLATEITSAGIREVTVTNGGLEWLGVMAEPQRAEPGALISMPVQSGIPGILGGNPFMDLGNGIQYQTCSGDARYAFETE